MFPTYIIIAFLVSLAIENGEGAIWDCNNKYQHKHPESSADASWCAVEGSSCSGPGRVYYGEHLTWTYKDIALGEQIDCSNAAFGCDPLWGTRKRCYIDRPDKVPYVRVDFSRVSILKTNNDAGDEEWIIPNGNNEITMNVDHIQYGAMGNEYQNTDWNLDNGCSVSINDGNSNGNTFGMPLITESNEECDVPAPQESSDRYGLQLCFIPSAPNTVVTKDVFEAGVTYTFNFQVGDVDANGFDNGPIFDFTYTEPDHRDIDAIQQTGYIERYFTRTGSDGRRARLHVTYTVFYYYDDLPVYSCN